MDFIKWLALVAFLAALIAAVIAAIAGVPVLGTDTMYSLQEAATGPALSEADTPLLRELMRSTFGYDQYVSGQFEGVVPVIFAFVFGMGALYLLFIIFRVARAILG